MLFYTFMFLYIFLIAYVDSRSTSIPVLSIKTLSSSHMVQINATSLTNNFYSANLALTSDSLVIPGTTSGTLTYLNKNTLAIQSTVSNSFHTSDGNWNKVYVNDLNTHNIYYLMNSNQSFITQPDTLAYLLSSDNKTWIPLSQTIFIGYESALFMGLNAFAIADADVENVYVINLTNGNVTFTGSCLKRWQPSNSWLSFGILEHFPLDSMFLVYGNTVGKVERQAINDNMNSLEEISSYSFDQLAGITLDVQNFRWYFYNVGNSTFGNNPISLGFSTADLIESFPTSQPTSQPSSLPSGQPTSVPTLAPASPKIISISTKITSTTASITCTLDFNAMYPGIVFCAAFDNQTSFTSLNQISTSGSSTKYQSSLKTVQVTVTIKNLIPLTNYTSYCFVKTDTGYQNSLTEAQTTKRLFKTTCCKTMSFSNAPSYLYANSQKYLTASVTSYTFIYQLQYLPTSSIKISPVVLDSSNNVVSYIESIPSSNSFTSQSLTKQSAFILSMKNSSISGSYTLYLSISGDSNYEYDTLSTSLSILNDEQPPVAPNLISVQFSDNGNQLYFTFDSSTNLAGKSLGIEWLCSDIFYFKGCKNTKCTWLNSTAIIGKFESFTNETDLPTINTKVILPASTLQPQCASTSSEVCKQSYPYNSLTTLLLTSSSNPITPSVILRIPSSVGSCDNVTIDPQLSTGFGGRSWSTVTWAVSIEGSLEDTSQISNYLTSFGVNIKQIITIPRSYFQVGNYLITLQVTNFLGKSSSQTKVIQVIGNPDIPKLSIIGSNSITTTANQALTVYSKASFSSCTDTSQNQIIYNWYLFQSSGVKVSYVNSNKDPSIAMLPSFTLAAGQVYSLTVNATVVRSGVIRALSSASMVIIVEHGQVVASIKGGLLRQLSTEKNLTLDGSASYDEDVSTTTGLTYQWSCKSLIFSTYGQSCDSIFLASSQTTSMVTILGANMNLSESYSIQLSVSSSDGRSSATTMSVQPLATGSPSTNIVSSFTKFNPNQNISLTSQIQGSYDLYVLWEAYVSNQNTSFVTYTPRSKYIPSSFLTNSFSFNVLFSGASFTEGSYVTFRVTASGVNAEGVTKSSYCELIVLVNSPPSSGSYHVTPVTGDALSTVYTLQASDWVDDPSDYPLTYSFSYSKSSTEPSLNLQSRGISNSISSTFPAGYESLNYTLTSVTIVFDSYSASATTSTSIKVIQNNNINVSDYLTSNLQSAFASSDSSLATQTVNNVATTINVVNCSLTNATFCANINRQSCSSVPNTCGNCFDGFIGISGYSNSKCHNQSDSSSYVMINSPCVSNDDCLYGNCTLGVCTEPLKTCPSQSPNSTCSDHGYCQYTDISGVLLDSPCGIFNMYCQVNCICDEGYSGQDCSLDPMAANQRDQDRYNLCYSIVHISNISIPSVETLETLVSSLLVSFSPTEIFSEETMNICKEALSTISTLADEGYLVGSSTSVQSYLVQSTSNFIVSNGTDSTLIVNTMDQVSSGLLQTMANGQAAMDIVTDNIKLTLRKDLVSDMTNLTMSPPQTTEESQYGTMNTMIEMTGYDSDACDTGDGYSQMILLQWGKMPFQNTTSLSSPMIRMSTPSTATTRTRQRKLTNTDSTSPTTAAYYITLQFTSAQNFNFSSVIYEETLKYLNTHDTQLAPNINPNVTFPDCTTFSDEKSYPCTGCNISAYTNYNVTFQCHDMSQLCSINSRRQLGSDDDAISSSQFSSTQYAALFVAMKNSFIKVLSTNPFNMNLEQAKIVISFVGSLLLIFIIGCYYFAEWDRYDKYQLVYTNVWPPKTITQAYQEQINHLLKKTNWKSKKSPTNEDEIDPNNPDSNKEKNTKSSYSNGRKTTLFRMSSNRAHERQRSYNANRLPDIIKPVLDDTNDDQELDNINNNDDAEENNSNNGNSTSTKKKPEKMKFFTSDINDFIDLVLPSLFHKISFWSFLKMSFKKHDYFNFIFRPSLSNSRLVRWFDLVKSVLIALFIDTLFFDIFYSNDGTCEAYSTEAMCILPLNSITSQSKCNWNAYDTSITCPSGSETCILGECSLAQPPNDFIFVIILALITVLCTLPLEIVLNFVIDEFGRRRPRLEEIGLSSDYWLGNSTYRTEKTRLKKIDVQQIDVSLSESMGTKPKAHHVDQSPLLDTLQSMIAQYETYAKQAEQAEKDGNNVSSQQQPINKNYHMNNYLNFSKKFELLKEKLNYFHQSKIHYQHFIKTEEELSYLLSTILLHFEQNNIINQQSLLLNLNTLQQKAWYESIEARNKLIYDLFHIKSDGQFIRPTIWEYIRYGSSYNRLICKLDTIKEKEYEIKELLITLSNLNHILLQEICLLNEFVLENFSVFKRWILNTQLFCFESMTIQTIHPLHFFLVWFIIYGSIFFFFYWIFAWTVRNGQLLLYSWGINFMIGFLQDFFMIQFFKIYLFYLIGFFSIKPQLTRIHRHLKNVLMAYTQGFVPLRKHILTQSKVILSHHWYASCRAAYCLQGNIHNLFISHLIRMLDDHDILICRESYEKTNTIFWIFVGFVPIVLILFGETFGDVVLDVILPTFCSGFFLINTFLYHLSPMFLVIIYLSLFGLMCAYFVLIIQTNRYYLQKKLSLLMKVPKTISTYRHSFMATFGNDSFGIIPLVKKKRTTFSITTHHNKSDLPNNLERKKSERIEITSNNINDIEAVPVSPSSKIEDHEREVSIPISLYSAISHIYQLLYSYVFKPFRKGIYLLNPWLQQEIKEKKCKIQDNIWLNMNRLDETQPLTQTSHVNRIFRTKSSHQNIVSSPSKKNLHSTQSSNFAILNKLQNLQNQSIYPEKDIEIIHADNILDDLLPMSSLKKTKSEKLKNVSFSPQEKDFYGEKEDDNKQIEEKNDDEEENQAKESNKTFHPSSSFSFNSSVDDSELIISLISRDLEEQQTLDYSINNSNKSNASFLLNSFKNKHSSKSFKIDKSNDQSIDKSDKSSGKASDKVSIKSRSKSTDNSSQTNVLDAIVLDHNTTSTKDDNNNNHNKLQEIVLPKEILELHNNHWKGKIDEEIDHGDFSWDINEKADPFEGEIVTKIAELSEEKLKIRSEGDYITDILQTVVLDKPLTSHQINQHFESYISSRFVPMVVQRLPHGTLFAASFPHVLEKTSSEKNTIEEKMSLSREYLAKHAYIDTFSSAIQFIIEQYLILAFPSKHNIRELAKEILREEHFETLLPPIPLNDLVQILRLLLERYRPNKIPHLNQIKINEIIEEFLNFILDLTRENAFIPIETMSFLDFISWVECLSMALVRQYYRTSGKQIDETNTPNKRVGSPNQPLISPINNPNDNLTCFSEDNNSPIDENTNNSEPCSPMNKSYSRMLSMGDIFENTCDYIPSSDLLENTDLHFLSNKQHLTNNFMMRFAQSDSDDEFQLDPTLTTASMKPLYQEYLTSDKEILTPIESDESATNSSKDSHSSNDYFSPPQFKSIMNHRLASISNETDLFQGKISLSPTNNSPNNTRSLLLHEDSMSNTNNSFENNNDDLTNSSEEENENNEEENPIPKTEDPSEYEFELENNNFSLNDLLGALEIYNQPSNPTK